MDKSPEAFINSIINKYKEILPICRGVDKEDLLQEGWIGLMQAKERYNKKLAQFSTYAYFWVDWYIAKTIHKEINTLEAEGINAETYKRDNSYTSGGKTIPDLSSNKYNSLPDLQGLEELEDKEREILELYAEGYTQEEISNKSSANYTHQHISRIINQAIEKVGAFYEA